MEVAILLLFVVTGILFIAAILLTVLLAQGKCLILLIGPTASREANTEKLGKAQKSAKRMAFVCATFALLLITIAAYKAAELASASDLSSFFLMANNAAFILFVVALIVFFVMQRYYKDPLDVPLDTTKGKPSVEDQARLARRKQRAKMDAFPVATLVFLIVIILLAFVFGIFFSLI